MNCCRWWMCVLLTNWWTGQEQKEKMFLLCDDDLLLLMDLHPSRTFRDRSRTERENVSTLQWWSVAANRCASFKQIDGQVENRRRCCFYFAMMICCWWCISVLQGHLGTAPNRRSDWIYFGLMISFANQMPLRKRHSMLGELVERGWPKILFNGSGSVL